MFFHCKIFLSVAVDGESCSYVCTSTPYVYFIIFNRFYYINFPHFYLLAQNKKGWVTYIQIAELVVNLLFKGGDSAGKALKNVKTGLGEVKSMSLEAKAAIAGVIYGLERLMSASAQQGQNLVNFNALTGLSTERLQEWQYAARQAGVANEELTGSVKSVQTSMTNMLLGKGAPEGLAMLANKVGFDKERARDTFYVMEQLQKFAKVAPPDVTSNLMKSFGLSEGVIAAMQRNAFRPDVFAHAPKYSMGEQKQLSKVDAAMGNLYQKIQMAMGHFTAQHGMQLVKDVSQLVNVVLRLADAFVKLAETVQLFGALGKVFEGWTRIFDGISKASEAVKKGTVKDNIMDALGATGEVVKGAGMTFADNYLKMRDEYHKAMEQPTPAGVGAGSGTQNINNNINMNFQHDGKDHKKTSDSVQKAIQRSYRQSPAQGQGS